MKRNAQRKIDLINAIYLSLIVVTIVFIDLLIVTNY